MNALVCEMCGSNNLIKQDGCFVCQMCGTKYSIEEAKRMMIEGTVQVQGTVKFDNTNRISNLYQLAEMDIDKNDCGNALKYYESIIVDEPTSWKAQFFIPYIKAWNSKKGEICTVAKDFYSNYSTVIKMINDYADINEQQTAIKTVFERSKKLLDMLNKAIISMYNHELEWQPFVSSHPSLSNLYEAKCEKTNHDTAARNEMVYKSEVIYKIMSTLGDEINLIFNGNSAINNFAVDAWKEYVNQLSTISNFSSTAKEEIASYSEKIRQYDADYSALSSIPGISKVKISEIEQALINNNKIQAVKICRECNGMGLAEAKAAIEKLAAEKGISIESSQESRQNKTKPAEYWIRMFGIFGLLPFTFIAGIFVLCFINKAKKENGGTLSKKSRTFMITGIVGFCAWLLVFIFMFSSIGKSDKKSYRTSYSYSTSTSTSNSQSISTSTSNSQNSSTSTSSSEAISTSSPENQNSKSSANAENSQNVNEPIKVDWLVADEWYTSTELNILHVQNCVVDNITAGANGSSVLVKYYPICKNCHTAHVHDINGIGFCKLRVNGNGNSLEKIYHCPDCGGNTTVRLILK